MAISPSGSVHRFFLYPTDGRKVVSASNIFGTGSGVDVKGWGSNGAGCTINATRATRQARWRLPLAELGNADRRGAGILAGHRGREAAEIRRRRRIASRRRPARATSSHDKGVTHWKFVNETALANFERMVPGTVPGRRQTLPGRLSVSLAWLKRDLQEDISALPIGIRGLRS